MDIERLKELTLQRIETKRAEDAKATERRKLDAEIAALLEEDLKASEKVTGSVGRRLEDVGIRVVATFSQTRSISGDFERDFDGLPETVRDIARWKPECVSAKFESLSDADKLIASKYVTTKAASPSIKVEVL